VESGISIQNLGCRLVSNKSLFGYMHERRANAAAVILRTEVVGFSSKRSLRVVHEQCLIMKEGGLQRGRDLTVGKLSLILSIASSTLPLRIDDRISRRCAKVVSFRLTEIFASLENFSAACAYPLLIR
jgi:hypothetical protein